MSKQYKTVEQLIREHSKARVLKASKKMFSLQPSVFGSALPSFSRCIEDQDVVELMVRKYAK